MALSSKDETPTKYTLEVGSRWYKAPELLFGSKNYNSKIDLWSLGCILAELLQCAIIPPFETTPGPLFQGQSDIDQVVQIAAMLGNPSTDNWPELESLPDFGKILFKEQASVPLGVFLMSRCN